MSDYPRDLLDVAMDIRALGFNAERILLKVERGFDDHIKDKDLVKVISPMVSEILSKLTELKDELIKFGI